jgi:hypothetical protein
MTYSYDDRASNGRLVFFWPMSHCWKCCFVQRYEDDGTVGKETPRQTAFKAHPAGNCAEDLCHALCIYIVLEPCRSAKPYVLVVNCYLLQRLQQVVHRHRLVGMSPMGTRGHQPVVARTTARNRGYPATSAKTGNLNFSSDHSRHIHQNNSFHANHDGGRTVCRRTHVCQL